MTSSDPAEYEIDDDPRRVDVDAVWRFLSTEAYWNRWRTRDDVEAQVRGAWRVVGAYETHSGDTVGFARSFSDGVSDAYLGDVFVLPGHRGRGLSQRLLAAMIDEGPGAHLRWFLVTSDAHGLYRQFGFDSPDERVMVRQPRRRD